MIRLVYSNRAEELLSELASRVRTQQLRDGALLPVPVVVQSVALEAYLRLGVARAQGIAGNLQMPLITRFAASELAREGSTPIAGANDFAAMALALFLDEAFVARPEVEAVRAYLQASASREGADVRRVQLASRVGRLFEQYTYSRADLLSAWTDGKTLEGAARGESEPWQRRMWVALFGPGGLGRRRGLAPLHEAVAAFRPASSTLGAVHVFGFAHFGATFHDFLARLGTAREVVVYTFTPCEGFWEDFDPRDPQPLQLWARPGREHVRALDAAAGYDHDDRFVEPAGDTLLASVQRDILHRQAPLDAPRSPAPIPGDESFVFFEHASIRRELEAVASEIWRLVERDETLRFDEIAVLVPASEAQAYLTHLPSVFREAHEIPLQTVDVPTPDRSRVLEAVDLLLSLPLGRFTRQELLGLLVHPCVVATLDEVDAEAWLGWCDALGIVHGADRADHAETYIERDILNWDQGLRRLALGAFMAGSASGERRTFDLGSEAYLPHELAATEMRDAAAMGLLVRSLVADARFVCAAELTAAEWARVLCDLVGTYVDSTSDAEAEVLAACLRGLRALADVDVGDRRVSYRVARELARERLASAADRRGSEGVVVSRIGSVRLVPFRVVFACGMGEGRFPASESEDALDLRWAERRPGDVTTRERDKYAFLELLVETRDRIYLSYVSRDPLTGDAIAPSSVVQELLHTLGRGYARDLESLRRHHPLRRWDPRYFPALFPGDGGAPLLGTMRLPEARAEASVLALRRALGAGPSRVDRERLSAWAAVDPGWAAVAELLRVGRLPDVPARMETKIAVPMYALVKFLEFPLQGWARLRVGLDEFEDEDVLAREDEPFETDFREETLLLRSIFLGAKRGRSVADVYDETVRDRELRGTGPSGVFARAERTQHLRTLEAWREKLAALEVEPDSVEVHRFGRAGEHSSADRVHAALALDVGLVDEAGVARTVHVEIGGRTLPLGREQVSLTLARRAAEGKGDWARAERARARLRAFVDHAVFSASGVAEDRPRGSAIVIVTPEGTVTDRVRFAPLTRSEARRWLTGLLRDLLGGAHAYFFPWEAVFVHRRAQPPITLGAALLQARELLRDSDGPPALRSAYGPVPRPHEYPIPADAAAKEMAERRFGLLFDQSEEIA